MTPIEHSIFAFNFAALAPRRLRTPAFYWAAMVAAIAPDVDGLSRLFGADAYVRYHRTYAHGLLGATLVGMAAAALALKLLPNAAFRVGQSEPRADGDGARRLGWVGLLVAAVIGGVSHVLIDTLYAWPLPVLWPFSSTTFSWPVLPWGDVGVLAIMLASMFAHAHPRAPRRLVGALTLAVLAAYVAAKLCAA